MFIKRNIYLAILFIISFIILSFIAFGCVKPFPFKGRSMEPTLNDGDRIFFNTYNSGLERGDIVLFQYPRDQSKYYIKRIIGLPNETVEIKNGLIFINGKEVQEPYLDKNLNLARNNYERVKIAVNEYYVLGDNRDLSSDSRLWGTVPKSFI